MKVIRILPVTVPVARELELETFRVNPLQVANLKLERQLEAGLGGAAREALLPRRQSVQIQYSRKTRTASVSACGVRHGAGRGGPGRPPPQRPRRRLVTVTVTVTPTGSLSASARPGILKLLQAVIWSLHRDGAGCRLPSLRPGP